MKEVKFRIIELLTHQILIMKDWDEENDSSRISVIFFLDGIKVSTSFGYNDDEMRDKMFDEFSEETAQKVLDSAIELFNQG